MGAIVLDASKVNSNILPYLTKAKNTVQEAYSTSSSLKSSLPSSFSYKSTVNDIINQLYRIKREINDVNSMISKKTEKAKEIEKKNNSRASSITSSAAAIMGASVGVASSVVKSAVSSATLTKTSSTQNKSSSEKNTNASFWGKIVSGAKKLVSGAVNFVKDTGAKISKAVKSIWEKFSGKIKGVVNKTTEVTKTVFKKLKDTGAKVVNKTVSAVKKLGSKISNGIKKVGTKISSGVKSATNWVKDKAKVATNWVADKFNKAKDWTSNALKKTGAWISNASKTVWSGIKTAWNWITDPESWKKVGASVMNATLSFVKGVVSFVEAIGDFVVLAGAAVGTVGTALWDIGSGIVTGNWDWKATKGLWDGTKGIVAYNWTNALDESLGWRQYFDQWAYAPFKSDGIACKISEGVGYVAGVIALSCVTFGAGGVAVAAPAAGTMALTATAAGIGKYTAEEWNKNYLSISYGEQEIGLTIDYEKYSEIEKLKDGQSATITQQFTGEDGKPVDMIFTITKNGDKYSVIDGNGNAVGFNGVKESSTAKGLLVGTIKGGWEGLQYYVGGKIGNAQFTSVTSKMTSPVVKTVFRTGTRVGLDMVTGVAEVPFQSAVTMIADGKNWKEAWNANGGWRAVGTQAGIAGIMSFAGEAFSFRGNLGTERINTALLSGEANFIDSTLKNIDPKKVNKYVNSAIAQMTDVQFNDIINSGTFKNLDDTSKTIIANSLDSTKLKILTDSMTGKEVANLLENVNEKTFVNLLENSLNKNSITETLSIMSKSNEIQFDYLLKNIDNIGSTTETSRFLKNMITIYKEGNVAAQTKYKHFFKNFREHGIKHATGVASYAENLAKNIDGIDVEEVVYASFIHDFGMRGGYMYVDEEIAQSIAKAGGQANLQGKYIPIDSLDDLKFYKFDKELGEEVLVVDFLDNCTRKNHPLNSALSVLTDTTILPDSVDKDVVALLAMTHSKSTSGIKHFSSAKEWNDAIDKLDATLKQYNADHHTAYSFDADRIKSMINDPDKFSRLQNEALAVRDGDAMAPVVEQTIGKNKGTLMQDNTVSVVGTTEVRETYEQPILSPKEEYEMLVDKIYDLDGNEVRVLSPEEYFSKKIHIGEANLKFESSYVDGHYKATININNANQTPNATFDAIEERIGEVNTYTNCKTRSFEIVLPKEAEGTSLGRWYEETLDNLKNQGAKKHLVFDAEVDWKAGRITEQEYKNQLEFYKNLVIVYK